MRHHLYPWLSLLATLLLLGSTRAWAQQQINTQVNNQTDLEMNGHNGSTRNYIPSQFELLPSERLFAYPRSGMLPSEFRMNQAALGPLSPHGAVDYIAPQSPLQLALRLPPPLLYNPAYVPPLPANLNAPASPPPLPSGESFNLSRVPAGPSPFQLNSGPINRAIPGTIPPPAYEESTTTTYRLPPRQPVSSGNGQPPAARKSSQPASPATRPAGSPSRK